MAGLSPVEKKWQWKYWHTNHNI